MIRLQLSEKQVWNGFLIMKLFYCCFAIFVFAKFTILGDTDRYAEGSLPDSPTDLVPFLSSVGASTAMMDMLGFISRTVFLSIPVLIHIPSILLSFYGVYYAISRLDLNRVELIGVLLFLSTPSFAIWTSIISKEAIATFFMGVISGYLIDFLVHRRRVPTLLEFFCFFLCFVFKPQYLIAVAHIMLLEFLFSSFSLDFGGKVFFFLLICIVDFFLIYSLREEIEQFASLQHLHFSIEESNSTRNNPWVNPGDFFSYAPVGMVLAFTGPTLSEVSEKIIQLPFLLESIFVVAVIFCWFFSSLITRRAVVLNVRIISIFLVMMFWLLFVHYPFGALNPGSGIRYRQNFMLMIVAVVLCLRKFRPAASLS